MLCPQASAISGLTSRRHGPPGSARIADGGSPGDQPDRLGENLQQEAGQARRAAAPRMTVPRQPRHVRRQHRIWDAHPPETPPGQPACTLHDLECLRVPLLNPVIGTMSMTRPEPSAIRANKSGA